MRVLLNQRFITLIVLAAVIAALPLIFPSSYYFRVASLVWVSALAAIGLNVLMGQAGQVSLGHAAFFGIGAYAVAIGPTHLGIPPWAALLVGAVLSGILAYLVGRPILRLIARAHAPVASRTRAARKISLWVRTSTVEPSDSMRSTAVRSTTSTPAVRKRPR